MRIQYRRMNMNIQDIKKNWAKSTALGKRVTEATVLLNTKKDMNGSVGYRKWRFMCGFFCINLFYFSVNPNQF